MLMGQIFQPLNAQVIMKNNETGEITEITAESPLLNENGQKVVWLSRSTENNRAVININCNQSMLSNDYNNLTTFYRDNLGDVFALHFSGEPEVWNWEWRLDDYTLLASDPTETYTTSGTLTGNVSYGQNSTYGSGVQYTYAGYFTLADPYGGGTTQFSATIQTIDSQTGDVFIQGANISVDGVGSQVTDAIGYATFQNLINGQYSYTISASGYNTVNGEFTVSNEDVFFQIDFAPDQTYEALFIISEAVTGNSISNATVAVTGVGSQQTNTSGETTFSDLENGTYSYTISAAGYEDYSNQFTIDDWNATVPLALSPVSTSYNANFTITDFDTGLAIENATINLDGIGTASSDVSGQATFSDLEDGTYSFSVTADGYDEHASDFTITGANEDVNVILTPSGVGIDDNSLSSVLVSPNPAHTQIQVHTNPSAKGLVMTIYDACGKTLKSLPIESGTGRIDISEFDKGLYLYSVTSETSGNFTGKFVKN
jgi:carbon monoxide dehydrogenase subunit G